MALAALDRSRLNFRHRSYQASYLGAYAREEVKRYLRFWPRRAGKDDCSHCARVQKIVRKESQGYIGNYWVLYPEEVQARKAFWDNICGHGIRMIDHVPEHARAGKNWAQEADMQLHFRGGSILQVMGARYPNRLRGPNPIEVALSEWAQMNPGAWEVVRPILIANGGTADFNTTAFGRNHAWEMWEKVRNDPGWFVELLTVEHCYRDGPGEDGRNILSPWAPEAAQSIQQVIAQMLKEGVDPDFIQQEYFNSFAGVMTGSFYGREIEAARREGRIRALPHDPARVVHTFWDRGLTNAVWFVQNGGRELHIIDYLETQDEALPDIMDKLRAGHRAVYRYGSWVAGHDFFDTKEYHTGKSAAELVWDLYKARFEMAPALSVLDGIDAARALLRRCYFDENQCKDGLSAVSSYHREYDEKRRHFKSTPVHDWASHGADAFRYLAAWWNSPPEPAEAQRAASQAQLNYLQNLGHVGGNIGGAAHSSRRGTGWLNL